MSDASSTPTAHERLMRAARAAHDLSNVLWESLHDELELRGSAAERVGELSRRLADVCATIALLADAPTEEPLAPPEPAPEAGIEVRDVRPSGLRHGHEAPRDARAGGAASWLDSIERRLDRHHEDRLPFAVLLIEVLHIDRLAHAESPPELERLVVRVERAIGSELRPADLLTRESLGRYWLVTPETDALGARMLAERLAQTVRLSATHRGVPLEIAIGIAICPEDGHDASGLAAHAEVGVYAARAAGRAMGPAEDPPAA